MSVEISIIITSFKEPKTIKRAVSAILEKGYSGLGINFELITVIPDRPTATAALSTVKKYRFKSHVHIEDPGKGKPHALNLAFKRARGRYIVLTDGDVYLDKNAVPELVKSLQDKQMGGVSGRQISIDNRKTMFGFYSHLFNKALDLNRIRAANDNTFYPMSGYIMAVKRELIDFELPDEVLVDDGYISYMIALKGFKIAYNPDAVAYVSYPKNFNDYFKQKVRSTGGYLQLKQYDIFKNQHNDRGPRGDIGMFLFPLQFAKTVKEYYWALLLYPIRIYLWFQIFVLNYISPHRYNTTWKRVESSK
ncbi:MAG: glycosyltransferase [Candidatus Dojkabacteria bacterium]